MKYPKELAKPSMDVPKDKGEAVARFFELCVIETNYPSRLPVAEVARWFYDFIGATCPHVFSQGFVNVGLETSQEAKRREIGKIKLRRFGSPMHLYTGCRLNIAVLKDIETIMDRKYQNGRECWDDEIKVHRAFREQYLPAVERDRDRAIESGASNWSQGNASGSLESKLSRNEREDLHQGHW